MVGWVHARSHICAREIFLGWVEAWPTGCLESGAESFCKVSTQHSVFHDDRGFHSWRLDQQSAVRASRSVAAGWACATSTGTAACRQTSRSTEAIAPRIQLAGRINTVFRASGSPAERAGALL